MKKYNYIDLTRTSAMFGVVLYHILVCFSRNPYWFVYADYENETATYLCSFLNLSLVPIFVFCSGFLFQASMQDKEISKVKNILMRAKRLLLPYLLYGLLWLVPTYTFFDIPTHGRTEGTPLIEGYKSMLLGQFCDVSWFLLMLFWVSMIWIILRDLLKKKRFIIGAVVAAAMFFASHYLLAEINYYVINQIDIYLVIYFAGASFFWIADRINDLPFPMLMLISASGIVVCAAAAPYTSSYYWLYCVLSIVMPFIMVIFSMGLCKLKFHSYTENTHIYKWLLKHSFDIYLLQAPGMYLSFRLFNSLVGQNCALCVTISYIATIAIDFILVIILTYIRMALSGLYRAVRKTDQNP